jgi:hypothetical protein
MVRLTIIVFAVLIAATPAAADELFYALLVPRPGTGSSGSGQATLVLNPDETAVSYTITISGLTSPEIAAHIHRQDGSIAHTFPLGETKTGVWYNPGNIDVASLRLGQLFILVHTEQNPGGELRGNITDEEVGVEETTWGRIKALY